MDRYSPSFELDSITVVKAPSHSNNTMSVLRSSENIPTSPRVPTSPSGNSSGGGSKILHGTFECDFDNNPTKLYLSIQHRQWTEAIDRAKAHPQESKTWVSRREHNGSLRWRLLPLHAAVIFKAPEHAIQALLVSYPRAAKQKDDQGMLAAHLAFRNESPLSIVQMILMANPSAVDVQDRKGRSPLALAQKTHSKLREPYMEALAHTARYYAVATASFESNSIHKFRKNNENGGVKKMTELDAEKINLMARADALQKELEKTHGASEVLVNHVNSLEAQLSSKNDTESFLASKIAKVDSQLRDAAHAKELAEAQVVRERSRLTQENDTLKALIEDLTSKLKSKEVDETTRPKQSTTEVDQSTKNDLLSKLQAAQERATKAERDLEQMEDLLNQKIKSEHSLADQVSTLASRLADTTAGSCASAHSFQTRIEVLTSENARLVKSHDDLVLRINSVLKSLDNMTVEHERILTLSAKHESYLAEAQKQQEQLAANAARNEQLMVDATWEREEIVRILTRQAKEVEASANERKKLQESVQQQSSKMAAATNERAGMLEAIKVQKDHMNALRADLDDLRQVASEEGTSEESGSGSSNDEDSSDDSQEVSFDESNTEESVEDDNTTVRRRDTRVHDENDQEVESTSATVVRATFDSSIGLSFEIESCTPQTSEDEPEQRNLTVAVEDDLLPNTSTLTNGDSLLVEDEDLGQEVLDESGREIDQSLSEIESSVDHLCNEAARLVASMPATKN